MHSPPDLAHRFTQLAGTWIPKGKPLVVAVSGGLDSVALLHLLSRCPWLERHHLILAHFDHGLRPESQEDAIFTQKLAETLQIPHVMERWHQGPGPGNLQAQAREARYQFLLHTAKTTQAPMVITGHHGQDLAESFLERMLRGSGVQGLAGMCECRTLEGNIQLVRPLLSFQRAEMEAWMVAQGMAWREDPSNRSTRFMRTRIRWNLLPQLELLSPGSVRRLGQTARRLGQANIALDWMLTRIWPELDLMEISPKSLSLSREGLIPLPDELVVRCLVRCSQRLTRHPYPPGSRACEAFLKALRGQPTPWTMRIHGLEICGTERRILLTATTTPPGHRGRGQTPTDIVGVP